LEFNGNTRRSMAIQGEWQSWIIASVDYGLEIRV
jgi:hypothetical protein